MQNVCAVKFVGERIEGGCSSRVEDSPLTKRRYTYRYMDELKLQAATDAQ